MRRWLRVFIVGALTVSLPLHTARACHGLGGRCRSRSCRPDCCPPTPTRLPVGGWVVVSDVPLATGENYCLQPVCRVEFPAWQPVQCCVPADGSAHAVIVDGSWGDAWVSGACETVQPHVVRSEPAGAIVREHGVAVESTVIDAAQPAEPDSTAAAADRTVLPPPIADEPVTSAPTEQAPSGPASGGDTVEKPLPLPSGPDGVPAPGPLLPASGEQPVLQPIAAEPPAAAEKPADETATATAEPMPSPAREETPPAAPPVPATPPVAEQPQPQPAAEAPLPEIAEKAPPKAVERNLFDEVAEEEEEQAGKPDADEPSRDDAADDDAADDDAADDDKPDAEAAAGSAEDDSAADTPAATEAADGEAADGEAADGEAADDEAEDDDDAADEDDEDAADDADEEDGKQKEADPFSAILRTPGEPVRRWTDDTGLHQTVGRLVEVHPGRVRILKANGAHASVPLERLSPVDRAYVFETGARVADGRESPKPAPVDTAGL